MNILDIEFLKKMKLSHFSAFFISALSMVSPFLILMYMYDRDMLLSNNIIIVLIMLLGLGVMPFMPAVMTAFIYMPNTLKSKDEYDGHALVVIISSIMHTIIFISFILLLHIWPSYVEVVKYVVLFENINDFISVSFYFIVLTYVYMFFMVVYRFLTLIRKRQPNKTIPK